MTEKTIKQVTIWQTVSGILALLLVISIYTNGFNFGVKEGSSTQTQPTNTAPTQFTAEGDDPSLGPDDADIVVIEYSDYECPYCGAAYGSYQGLIDRFKSQDPSWEPAEPGLKQLAEEGKIKLVFRDFPLSIHANAQKAAEAAECADEQGQFWAYHDKLFENQNALGVSALKSYAVDLGLDSEQFNSCLDSGKYAAEVREDMQQGIAAGVSGTPGFVVNGQLISGAQSFSVFEKLIS